MKKKVEYSRDQAEQMNMDFNEFFGMGTELHESDIDFLNHKFPTKIEYVGKVWKSETNKFIAYFEQIENGHYVGYGVNFRGNWFKGIACSNDLDELSDLVEATQEEWQDALKKEAKRRYNVGDKVKCLTQGNPIETIKEVCWVKQEKELTNYNDLWGADKEEMGILLLRDGIWAEKIEEAPSQVIINGIEYIKKTES